MQNLNELEYVILDVETTGLSPQGGDRVVEIAALKVKDSKPVEKYHSLINPERNISWGAFMVNRISQEMVEAAPTFQRIVSQLMEFLGDTPCLVAHNASFDMGFLRNELFLANCPLKQEWNILDTVKMSRALLPNLLYYRLWFVARSLGIDQEQEHRAMGDVYLTYQVFIRLLDIAQKKEIVDFPALLKLCGQARRGSAV